MRNSIYIILIPLVIGACATSKTQSSKEKESQNSVLNYEQQSQVIKMLFDGEKAELKGNATKAISYYRECVEIDPNNPIGYFKLATVYHSMGNYPFAVSRINEAIRIDPNNKWYYLLLTQSYLAMSDFPKATESIKKVIELEPDNIEYQLELVELYAQQNKFDKAIQTLDEVEKRYGSNPEFNIRKQEFYMSNGQSDKAIETCKLLIQQYPDQPNFYGLLAILYESIGDKENEFLMYKKLVELDPENGLAHLKLSGIYQERENKEMSEAEMKEVFKSRDLDIEVKVNVLTQYYEKLQFDNTIWPYVEELLINMELANPNDARTYSVYSDFLTLQQSYEPAREYLLKSLEIKQDRFLVWNQLILLDSQLADWKAMAEHSEEALSLFPSNPALYYYQGIAYFQLKQYDDAIEILETGKMIIFKSESGIVDFYILLGDSYNAIKKYNKSDENYELALKVNPDNPYVLNNFAYYLSLRKDKLERAEKMAKRAVELEPNQYNYQDTYGWVLFQAGKYEEAVFWLNSAVNNGGRVNGEIVEHLGDALYKTGKSDEALEKWKEAKQIGDASALIDEKIRTASYVE